MTLELLGGVFIPFLVVPPPSLVPFPVYRGLNGAVGLRSTHSYEAPPPIITGWGRDQTNVTDRIRSLKPLWLKFGDNIAY